METAHVHITQPGADGAVHAALGEAAAVWGVLDPERRAFLSEALAAAAALSAAERLGVFARLTAGPANPPALAHDCAIGERGAALLLAALASLGLVESTGDDAYRLTMVNAAKLLAFYAPLAQVIRNDRPLLAADTLAGAEALYPETVPILGALFAPAAARAAEHLSSPGLRVLDVGAGAAPWSLALAVRDLACYITAVDVPAVLAATRRAVAEAGCEAQFAYLAGDIFAVDWGRAAFDLAIAGNLCHLFDADANRRLLGRLFDALRPGGTLAIIDALPNEQRDGPRPVALYALGLILRTQRGRVYPYSTYAGWLHEAGYDAVERIDLGEALPLSLIMARRP
jgi:SAM-dependent methyltransferase